MASQAVTSNDSTTPSLQQAKGHAFSTNPTSWAERGSITSRTKTRRKCEGQQWTSNLEFSLNSFGEDKFQVQVQSCISSLFQVGVDAVAKQIQIIVRCQLSANLRSVLPSTFHKFYGPSYPLHVKPSRPKHQRC
jgi:hypothetical protein